MRVFLRDRGIMHLLLGIDDPGQATDAPGLRRELAGVRAGKDVPCPTVVTTPTSIAPTRARCELDLMLLRGGERFGFEFKCSDAPRTTGFDASGFNDLGLAHLWVVYPGDLGYRLSDRITALPLKQFHDLQL